MRLIITCDPHRRGLRVQVERALNYPPGHVPGLLAATVTGAFTQPPTSAAAELAELVPAPRTTPEAQPVPAAPANEADAAGEGRLRWRVLRALDNGTTVEQAARKFGLDPTLINRWDDDAAIDAHTDQLADTASWPARAGA